VAKPQAGQSYKLTGETIGTEPGAIKTGAVGKVREVVPAKEPGAHDDKEDAVVLEFSEPTLVMEDGAPKVGEAIRAVSFGLDFFSENFEGVK
jgi:hypothetical protein